MISVKYLFQRSEESSLVWNDNQTHIRVSGLTDRGQRATFPPGKLNVKARPSPVDILIISIL